jgi:hypothetical protein
MSGWSGCSYQSLRGCCSQAALNALFAAVEDTDARFFQRKGTSRCLGSAGGCGNESCPSPRSGRPRGFRSHGAPASATTCAERHQHGVPPLDGLEDWPRAHLGTRVCILLQRLTHGAKPKSPPAHSQGWYLCTTGVLRTSRANSVCASSPVRREPHVHAECLACMTGLSPSNKRLRSDILSRELLAQGDVRFMVPGFVSR